MITPTSETGEGSPSLAHFSIQILKRELAEARREAAKWKANHDNQVAIKSVLIQRPDLGDRAQRIAALIEENKKMRDAIKVALNSFADDPDSDSSWLLGDKQITALSKLKSFI